MTISNAPLVTVLMPVYNGAQYLAAAIESILKQTYPNIEFLIIDDGSTDHSSEIIDRAGQTDQRIRFMRNPENLGLIRTLNKGLDLARGRYLARMDADDISLPNRLTQQVEFMQAHPSVAVCGTWSETFNHPHLAAWETHFPTDHATITAQLLLNTAISHPTAMFSMAAFNAHQLRYSETAVHAEDYDLWVRASEYFELANVPETLFRYRFHPSQISNQHSALQAETAAKIRRRLLSRLGIDPDSDELSLHTSLARHQYENGPQYLERYLSWTDKLYYQNKKINSFNTYSLFKAFHIHSRALLRQNLIRHPVASSCAVLGHTFYRNSLLAGSAL